MDQTLWITTAVDVAAVVLLAGLLWRAARDRVRGQVEQQDALARLRGELQQLLEDAEARAQRLDQTLAARETALRGLLARMEQAQAPAPAPRATRSRTKASRTAPPLVRPFGDDRIETIDEVPADDPAELRLRRELEVALGRSRLA